MLHGFFRCRDATQWAPYREARVLFFAKRKGPAGPGGGDAKSPDDKDPLENLEEALRAAADAAAKYKGKTKADKAAEGIPTDPVEAGREDAKKKVDAVVDGDETPEGKKVDDERGKTKDDIRDAIESKEGKALNVAETLRKFEDTREKLEASIALFEEFKKEAPKAVSDDWVRTLNFMKDRHTELYLFLPALRVLAKWEKGEMPPTDFARWAKDNLYTDAHGFDQKEDDKRHYEGRIQTLDHVVKNANGPDDAPTTGDIVNRVPKIDDPNLWQTYNNSKRQVAVQTINKEILLTKDGKLAIDKLLAEANESIDLTNYALNADPVRKNYIEGTALVLKELKKEHERDAAEGKATGGKSTFRDKLREINNFLGIEWYSPAQIMQAFGDVREAFVNAFKARNDRKAAEFGAKVGTVISKLPFGLGDEVSQTLDAALSDRNSKEKNNFKEYLAGNNLNFNLVFGDGGLLDTYKSNPNKARAILEFGAEKGWLYDFPTQLQQGTSPKDAIILGKWRYADLMYDMPEGDMIRNYYSLQFQNGSGREKQMEGGAKFVYSLDKAELFLKALRDNLNGHDYWSAAGVVKRAFERGMKGELSPWIATIVMDHIQTDPFAQKYMSRTILETIGSISLYTTAFTTGYLRLEKDSIVEWGRSGAKDLAEAGVLGKVMKDVREELIAKDSSLADKDNKDDLLHKIAQVMAAQTVTLENGRQVSIFASRYDYYNAGSGQQIETKVGDLDSDFYTNRSEAMMSDENIVREILDYRSQGQFQEEARAVGFLNNVLELNSELNDSSEPELRAGAKRFRKVMGDKLKSWLEKGAIDSRQSWLAKYKMKGHNEYLMDELLDAGFITAEDLSTGWGPTVLQRKGMVAPAKPAASKPKKGDGVPDTGLSA